MIDMYPPSTFRITDETTIYPSSILHLKLVGKKGAYGTGEEDEGGERMT